MEDDTEVPVLISQPQFIHDGVQSGLPMHFNCSMPLQRETDGRHQHMKVRIVRDATIAESMPGSWGPETLEAPPLPGAPDPEDTAGCGTQLQFAVPAPATPQDGGRRVTLRVCCHL